jgi:hypothetical protein
VKSLFFKGRGRGAGGAHYPRPGPGARIGDATA